MRPTKIQFLKHAVCVADKVLVGEKQQHDVFQLRDLILLNRIGDGFLMFRDGRTGETVALIDDFTDEDEARGYVNKDPHSLNDLDRLFTNLKAMSDQF